MSTPLQEALRDVEEGVSLRKASKVHRVPLTTLRRYRKNPTGIRPTVGRPTYLSADDEKTLEDMLIHSTNLLVGVKKSQYMKTIIECAHEKGAYESLSCRPYGGRGPKGWMASIFVEFSCSKILVLGDIFRF